MGRFSNALTACLLAMTFGIGTACAQTIQTAGAVPSGIGAIPNAGKPKVKVDASLRNDPTAIVVWIAYGLGLAMNHPGLDAEQAAGLHTYVPTFDSEYSARKNQVVVWGQIKAKDPTIANAYMTQLVAIDQAGFLREYVWEYYWRQGWVEPRDLNIAKFDAWRQQNLPGLKAETFAHLGI